MHDRGEKINHIQSLFENYNETPSDNLKPNRSTY